MSRISDAVRGERFLRRDDAGRPAEVIRADGQRVRLHYRADGGLRRVDCGDLWIETDPPREGDPALQVRDPAGFTEVDIAANGWSIARGRSLLRAQNDKQGRPVRVHIPGSSAPLEIAYRNDSCRLSCRGRTLARIAEGDDRRRIRMGRVVFEEGRNGLRWTLCARSAGSDELRAVLLTDLMGRTIRRSWCDGLTERFQRDGQGRLIRRRIEGAIGDRPPASLEFRYREGQLSQELGPQGIRCRELDAGGRITALNVAADGAIRYEYDPRGRRIARHGAQGTIRYRYDGLDRLIAVERPDGARIEMAYDGLGRRLQVRRAGDVRFEHRDARGRLWSVTDSEGKALYTYVWHEDRPLLRIDGSLDSPPSEAYLTDPVGTPLLAAVFLGAEGSVRLERLGHSLWGSAADAFRPTIFGHFGDPATGLVHFGARDLDPETGSFLTPDPWHGGDDDERRWIGLSPDHPEWVQEHPSKQQHHYVLCGHDPVGRADYDGHVSGGAVTAAIFRGLGNLVLGPTWGMPLTSVSLFFFLPFNIYMEIIAGILAIFTQRHLWNNHTIFGLRGFLGSLRQGQLSFALNGFLPRVVAGGGITSDRAVAIGNVIWIHRRELQVLERPLVVEVDDIDGSGGAVAFSDDPNRHSVVALEATDDDGKVKIHVSFWSRGYGNAVKTVPPGGLLAFEDREVGGKRPGTIQLALPVPLDVDVPESAKDDEKLAVRELLFNPSGGTSKRSTALLLEPGGLPFVLQFEQHKNEKLAANDAIQVMAPDSPNRPDHAHVVIGKIENEDDFSFAFLFGQLPARFMNATVTEGMTIYRIIDDPSVAVTEDWEDLASKDILEASDPVGASPWPPRLAKDDLVRVEAATPAAATPTVGFPNPPPTSVAYAQIKQLIATLEVSEALPGGFGASTDVLLMRAKGKLQNAKLKDAAKDTEVEFVADPDGIEKDDYVSIRISGTGATTYAQITNLNGKAAIVDYLDATPAYAGPTDLLIRKLVDLDGDKDPQGASNAPAGTGFEVETPRFESFVSGRVIHLKSGATEAIRSITKLAKARIELTDEAIGTKPFKVGRAKHDPELCRIKKAKQPALQRFLRHTGGDNPSAYGTYPDFVLRAGFDDPGLVDEAQVSVFYVQGAAGLHEDYRLTWEPLEFGGDRYFVLDSPLPIFPADGGHVWKIDPDTDLGASLPAKLGAGYSIVLREFEKSGAVRGLPDSVTAHPAEVVLPRDPQFRYTLGESLEEHEIFHTLQGNYWGPLLGALPLQALILSVADLAELKDDVNAPGWFRDIPSDFFGGSLGFSAWQTFSIGGIMYFAWKFLFLPPAYFSEDARNAILDSNFSFWNRIFNPFWGNLIAKFPEIDPNLSHKDSKPGIVLARLIAPAMDLRSWTPFLGFVPTWLPDSGRNFVEQGASRMSGDLYTTILSTDDRFNAKLTTRIGGGRNVTKADIEKPLGSVFRMMVFPGGRWDSVIQHEHANQPANRDSTIAYRSLLRDRSILEIEADQDTLFQPDLYEEISGGGATLQLQGPSSNPAPVDFLMFPDPSVHPDAFMRPRLRNLVPMPPRVNRTAGVYFIPSQPGVYECTAFDEDDGDPIRDAGTQQVELTVSGEVTLGGTSVPFRTPPAHPGVPNHADVTFERFITGVEPLTLKDEKGKKGKALAIEGYEERLDVTSGAAAKAAITRKDKRWDVAFGDTTPATVRIRLYRVFKKNDFNDDSQNDKAFDLTYDVPTLKNVRSYLDKDVWVPVRDFIVQVQDLPPLAAQTVKYDASVEVELAYPVTASKIKLTTPPGKPRFPSPELQGPAASPSRGEIWRFGPLDKVIEDDVVYSVEVNYGSGAVTETRDFDLTVEPIIELTAGGAFEASKGSPLELALAGGNPPFRLRTKNVPEGTQVSLDSPNRKVTVTVDEAPPSPQNITLTITDDDGKKGERTVAVS